MTGLEPIIFCTQNRRINQLCYILITYRVGLEPTSVRLTVLYFTIKLAIDTGIRGFEPLKEKPNNLANYRNNHSAIYPLALQDSNL